MSVETSEEEGEWDEEEEGSNTSVLVASAVSSFVIGLLSGYALMNLGTVGVAGGFLIGVAASGYYLLRKGVPAEVVGSASYVAGAVLVLAPSVLYLSNLVTGGVDEVLLFSETIALEEVDSVWEMLFGEGGPSTETVIQGSIDAVVPLVAWTVVFMMIALVLFAVGMLLSNRGSRQRRWKEQREGD